MLIFPTSNRTLEESQVHSASRENVSQIHSGPTSIRPSGSVTLSVTRFSAVPWTTTLGSPGLPCFGTALEAAVM